VQINKTKYTYTHANYYCSGQKETRNKTKIYLPGYILPDFFIRCWSLWTYGNCWELYVPTVEVRIQAGNRRTCLKFFPKRYYNDRSDYNAHGQKTKPHEPKRLHYICKLYIVPKQFKFLLINFLIFTLKLISIN